MHSLLQYQLGTPRACGCLWMLNTQFTAQWSVGQSNPGWLNVEKCWKWFEVRRRGGVSWSLESSTVQESATSHDRTGQLMGDVRVALCWPRVFDVFYESLLSCLHVFTRSNRRTWDVTRCDKYAFYLWHHNAVPGCRTLQCQWGQCQTRSTFWQ